MSNFCNWSIGEQHSRYEATNFICKYINENNLQNKNDKRIIIPNKKLSKLLKYDKSVVGLLKYPTIQKLIQIHFIKTN
jgi:chromatin remodeling complex protein RSC6